MKGAIIVILMILITGCANTSVQRLGNYNFPPVNSTTDILVYKDVLEINKPYNVLALIIHHDPGKYQRLNLEDAMIPIKEKARGVGANAVVIDNQDSVWSGIISRGIHVEARAIRVE